MEKGWGLEEVGRELTRKIIKRIQNVSNESIITVNYCCQSRDKHTNIIVNTLRRDFV